MSALPAEPQAGALARARLAGFVRTLRLEGYPVGLAESRDALAILAGADLARPARLMPAFRALFASRPADFERFPAVFDAYWRARRTGMRIVASGASARRGLDIRRWRGPDAGAGEAGPPDRVSRSEDGAEPIETHEDGPRRAGGSKAERLETTDFRHLTDPDEIARAHALAERLARSMKARLTRRAKAARRGRRIDLRRTLARAVSRAGEPIDLVMRRPRERPLKLVILLDASGSMSVYATTFVRFVHGILGAFAKAEAFLFHTRLVEITQALRERDPVRAAERFTLLAQGFGGGTRIGAALETFNRVHARRAITPRTAVMILSDGYDTGEPELLAREMKRLSRRARRVIWLNPMLGWRDYAPVARGMQAALPHVDLFAPAHDLESLAALEDALGKL
ncbi:vWA domain-containing protein [Salinarimonas sp.]|uniref:vWA domain-containing protein n=1 Tax=Salinarimonas sp. TaxID=2766526 RepID=UPI00391C5DC6